MQRLDEAFQALRHADPGNQGVLATQQKSAVVHLLDVSKVAASKKHVHHTNFAMFVRKTSYQRGVMTPTNSSRHLVGDAAPWLLLNMCRLVFIVPLEQIQHDLHWPN
jgi:hypothetical protein